MTSTMVLDQRQAQAVQEALEVLEGLAATERLAETKTEPLLPPGYATTIIAAELAQIVARQEAAFNHMATHIAASQDAEIERLRERVEELEKALGEKAPKGKGGTGSAKK